MPGQLRIIDLVVLLVYMAGVFGLGCWFARRSQTSQGFMAAGRSLAGWTVGLSIFGTYVSSIGFLGNTGKAFGANWNSWVFGRSLPLAAWLAARYFIPYYRSSNEISAYAHLEKRFGPWARTYALVCYLATQLARMGAILYLVALALAPLTGWDIKTIIVVTGIVVTIYTLLGGIEAVIWTDVVQSVVLSIGALVCAGVLLMKMPEGPGQLFEIANAADKFDLGGFALSLSEPTFWLVLAYGVFINMQNFGIDQSFVQRYVTAKSDKDAKFSVWLGALLFLPASTVFFFIGTGLFAFYQAQPGLLPDAVAANSDGVFPHFIVTQLPPGITGILIAAIFAAAMSSVDTSLNSSATLFHCDIYKRYLKPNASEKESMRVLHGATLVWGVAGTLVALAMIGVKSALDAWWNLQGIFAGGMLGLFLLGMISKKAKNPAAVVAVAIGVCLISWLSMSGQTIFHKHLTIIFGTTTVVLIGALLGSVLNRDREEGPLSRT
jgi:SSS family solute:Na+ symporter